MIADALPVAATCRLRYSRRRPDLGSDFQLIGEFGAYRPALPKVKAICRPHRK